MSKKTVKDKKLKRKQHQEEQLKAEQIKFDIVEILRDSLFETKPEIGEFLKKYVKSIRILVNHSKITIYPVNSYEISKVFIDFLDGHQLISDFNKSPREYYLYYKIDEEEITDKNMKYIVNFIQKLQEFNFIF